MLKILIILLSILTLVQPVIQKPAVLKAVHHIQFNSVAERDLCSSIAVGSHTLLTASHCFIGSNHIVIDNEEVFIKEVIFDENEHVLLVVDKTFDSYLKINEREPNENEHIIMYGYPIMSLKAVLREGKFEKTLSYHNTILYVWGFPVQNGDSGAGFISDENEVITVASIGNDDTEETGTFVLKFTPEQLKKIQ